MIAVDFVFDLLLQTNNPSPPPPRPGVKSQLCPVLPGRKTSFHIAKWWSGQWLQDQHTYIHKLCTLLSRKTFILQHQLKVTEGDLHSIFTPIKELYKLHFGCS